MSTNLEVDEHAANQDSSIQIHHVFLGRYALVMTNIAIEHGNLLGFFPLKEMIFCSYVSQYQKIEL